MRWHPRGYGGTRRDPDQVKQDGWHDQGLLAVSVDDHRLTWPERESWSDNSARSCTGRGWVNERRPMADWTPAMVEDRLESAADVFRLLPEVKPQGYFNAWPEYFHTFADQVGQEPQMRRPRPSPRQITQAEEAMLWLRWLEPEDARIVWLRANGEPWKKITWEIGLSRPAANRHWHYGIALIAR